MRVLLKKKCFHFLPPCTLFTHLRLKFWKIFFYCSPTLRIFCEKFKISKQTSHYIADQDFVRRYFTLFLFSILLISAWFFENKNVFLPKNTRIPLVLSTKLYIISKFQHRRFSNLKY